MSEGVTVTVVGIDRIVAELDRAALQLLPEVTASLAKGSLNIKKDWQAAWKGFKHAGALPYAIGYDIKTVPGGVESIIGPDKNKRQGALGNLLEFGSENNPPHPGGSPALDREAPRTEAAIDAILAKLLP